MIETRKTEERIITSDPKELLNKYLSKRVLNTYTENFIDEATGEVTSVERNEILFERATFIDQDILAKIRFSIEAGEIKEVEVSNQKRQAFECENECLYPYVAQVRIEDKSKKILLYATSLDFALSILRDYLELNFVGSYKIIMLKEFMNCIILSDELKIDSLKSEEEPDEKRDDRKYYQIEAKIYSDEDTGIIYPFVVYSINIDRVIETIENYINEKENKRYREAIAAGKESENKVYNTMLEEARAITIHSVIPYEFSEAYL
ncbi:RNA polymerase subunit sigma [uncultured Bacteroides sp.]|uniref:RNA polymerase subunit sigma n=1 Tax=uncultured Bacteroides sp. TaxID=162156 RepID=UPI002AA64DC1|nr:RNA polymerase subunit sigma [uncultured Bacteroides sp.]